MTQHPQTLKNTFRSFSHGIWESTKFLRLLNDDLGGVCPPIPVGHYLKQHGPNQSDVSKRQSPRPNISYNPVSYHKCQYPQETIGIQCIGPRIRPGFLRSLGADTWQQTGATFQHLFMSHSSPTGIGPCEPRHRLVTLQWYLFISSSYWLFLKHNAPLCW